MTQSFETLAIHAGQDPEPVTGAVVSPIFATSTYQQDAVGAPRQGYEYSRTANPTRRALEDCLAALEAGRRGLDDVQERVDGQGRAVVSGFLS